MIYVEWEYCVLSILQLCNFDQNSFINYFSFIIQGSEHHYGSYSMADRTLCFCCNVSLHRWEPTDEPWSEHERHSSKWAMTSCLLTASNEKYLQYSIDITTEQTFRHMELTGGETWISKNASLCWVFANRVTNGSSYSILLKFNLHKVLVVGRFSLYL